jgi:hypothetical protein
LQGHGRDLAASAGIKVFWFFSSEKNILPQTSVPESELRRQVHAALPGAELGL